MASRETISELNAELDAYGDLPSLDPRDHRYFDYVKMRTREPVKGERFLRSGRIPLCGYSRNYRDNTSEEGVSCYRVVKGKLASVSPFTGAFYGSSEMFWITGQVLQIDKGDGWEDLCGGDGEPLLYAARYVSRTRKVPVDMV